MTIITQDSLKKGLVDTIRVIESSEEINIQEILEHLKSFLGKVDDSLDIGAIDLFNELEGYRLQQSDALKANRTTDNRAGALNYLKTIRRDYL